MARSHLLCVREIVEQLCKADLDVFKVAHCCADLGVRLEFKLFVVQVSQRDAMQAALNANRALQNQLQLVKEHIEKFHHENGIQAVTIKQLRTNPSMFLWPVPTITTAMSSSAVMHAFIKGI